MQFGPETQTECDIRRAKTGHSSAPKTSHRVGGYWMEESSCSVLLARGMIRS